MRRNKQKQIIDILNSIKAKNRMDEINMYGKQISMRRYIFQSKKQKQKSKRIKKWESEE